MPLFLVHYELLQKPDVEYPALLPTLERLGAKRLTASMWALRSEMSLAALRDEIQQSAIQGDRFVIAQVSDCRTMGTLNRIDDV